MQEVKATSEYSQDPLGGVLKEGSEILYQVIFETDYLGKVSDILITKLKEKKINHLNFRILIYLFFYKKFLKNNSDVSPFLIEFGLDDEKVAVSVTFNCLEDIDFLSLKKNLIKKKFKSEIEKNFFDLFSYSDNFVIRYYEDIKQVELICIIYFENLSLNDKKIDCHKLNSNFILVKKKYSYINLGDDDCKYFFDLNSLNKIFYEFIKNFNYLDKPLEKEDDLSEDLIKNKKYFDNKSKNLDEFNKNSFIKNIFSWIYKKINKFFSIKKYSINFSSSQEEKCLKSSDEESKEDFSALEIDKNSDISSEADKNSIKIKENILIDSKKFSEDLLEEVEVGGFNSFYLEFKESAAKFLDKIKEPELFEWMKRLDIFLTLLGKQIEKNNHELNDKINEKEKEIVNISNSLNLELKKKDEILQKRDQLITRMKSSLELAKKNINEFREFSKNFTQIDVLNKKYQMAQQDIKKLKENILSFKLENSKLVEKNKEFQKNSNIYLNKNNNNINQEDKKNNDKKLNEKLEEYKNKNLILEEKIKNMKKDFHKLELKSKENDFKMKLAASEKVAAMSREQLEEMRRKVEQFNIRESKMKAELLHMQQELKRLSGLDKNLNQKN